MNNFLTKNNCTRVTGGDPNKVLLALLRTGLGTSVHALPAISQMISDGFEVTVNCKEFQRPIYDAIGCKTTCVREPFGLSWNQQHGNDYGRIVSLATWDQWQQWESGENTTATMDAFAEILGVELPEEFSWTEKLNVQNFIQKDYILFAPNSLEKFRSLPKEVADEVELRLKEFGNVVRIEGHECAGWNEFRDLITGATEVVAVEGGVLNVAGALGKKLLALIGMTEIVSTIEQYRRYIPDLDYRFVQGYQPHGCSMPCMRQKSRGFFNDRCLGKYTEPECLLRLDIAKVVEEFSLLRG